MGIRYTIDMKYNKTQSESMPALGRVAFKTGVTLDKKAKRKNRKSKYGQRELRRQLRGD